MKIETDEQMRTLKSGTKLKLKYRDGSVVAAYSFLGSYTIVKDLSLSPHTVVETFFGVEHPAYRHSPFALRIESVEVWPDVVPDYVP